MRFLGIFLALSGSIAFAQSVPAAPQPVQVVPSAPVLVPEQSQPDTTASAPIPSPADQLSTQSVDQPDANAGSAAATANVPLVAPPLPDVWQSAGSAVIGVLDRVDGGTKLLTIPVGGQAQSGDLQISVQACEIRPPNAVPDAAVFLTLTMMNDHGAPPLFRGWIVRSAPGAALAGNAGQSLRIINCT